MINDLRCRYTGIMAGRTVVGINARVVESDTRKADKVVDVMTGRTIQARRQMIERFSKADVTVMA